MGTLGFTLADRLGAKSIPCSVPGCSRTWIQMAGNSAKLGGRPAASDSDPTSRMCEPCRDKFRATSDVERRCARPGCTGTWTWTAAEQMTAFASRQPPPDRLCDDDTRRMATLTNREIPCSVEGCTRMTVFSRLAQLLAGAPDAEVTPPPTMCGPCGNVYEKIKDRQVTCGIQACKNKWTWTRDEQIKDYAAGLPNEAPRRLCESCKGVFGGITDREVRCRTSGCKNTWHWPREAQLNAAVAGKPAPKAPHRMCERCVEVYAGTKDVERPCRRPGCKHTWTDKRGAQLARAVRGKTGDPYPRYCPECEKEVGELEDREVQCKTEHCPGTWTWTAAQQLAAGVRPVSKLEEKHDDRSDDNKAGLAANGTSENGVHTTPAAEQEDAREASEEVAEGGAAQLVVGDGADEAPSGEIAVEGASTQVAATAPSAPAGSGAGKKRRRRRRREIRPPDRRCDDCLTFLKDRKTRDIPCGGCGTTIHWPPESQLQTHLGNWAEPTLCGACKRDLTEAARAAEREALRHHQGGQSVPGQPEGTGEAGASAAVDADPVSTDGGELSAPDAGAPAPGAGDRTDLGSTTPPS
jgi:hypothetical protein